jgi:hypothetical protein
MGDEDSQVRLTRHGVGYAATGPGFYVWELDARAAIESALALRHSLRPPRPAAPTRVRRLRARRTRVSG